MSDAASEPVVSKSWLVRHGYSNVDALAAAIGLLIVVAYAPFFFIPSWTPRFAVLLFTMPFTAVLLVSEVVRRRPIALAGLGFVGAALLSALFSDAVQAGILGVVGSETGVLMFLGSMGLLVLGTQLSEQGRRALVWATILGVGLSGLAGLLQVIVQADAGAFAIVGGRASGLAPSSVYFGATAACAFGLIVGRVSTNVRTVPLDAVLGVWFGFAVGLSGTRVAMGGALLVGLIALVQRRTKRSLLATGGLVVGIVIGRVVAGAASERGVTDRLSAGGGLRSQVWRYAFDSFVDRPVVGYGPGGFRQAIQDDLTVSFSASVRDGIESVWFNAHNVVLHVAATLGVIGLVAVLVLTVVIVRSARGPLAYGGLALVLSWTLQPFSLSTLPLAMLLLGGACSARATVPSDIDETVPQSPSWSVSPLLLLPGLALAAFLLAFDLSLQSAIDRSDPVSAAAWVERMPADPLLADVVAQLFLVESEGDPVFAAATVAWGERAIEEQPERALWYVRHGERLARLGNLEAALTALESAQAREPNSWKAVEGQFFILQALDRDTEAEAIRPLACELGIIDCDVEEDAGSSSD